MASPASTEAIEIRRRGRRRLIGAIAIVALLVVFVPMLLDNEPRQASNEPSTRIPSAANAPPLPAPAASTSATSTSATSTPAASPPSKPAASTPSKPAATDAKEAAAPPKVATVKPAPAATPPKPAAAAPRLEGFAVQVGAFRDEETLKQARAKLVAAGIAHYTERLGEGPDALTRLRAGPFPTREAAESARAKLQKASLDANVVTLP
ncbi:MAG TPA: SPOR domain-containing protein [Usitatibacter sp.]